MDHVAHPGEVAARNIEKTANTQLGKSFRQRGLKGYRLSSRRTAPGERFGGAPSVPFEDALEDALATTRPSIQIFVTSYAVQFPKPGQSTRDEVSNPAFRYHDGQTTEGADRRIA